MNKFIIGSILFICVFMFFIITSTQEIKIECSDLVLHKYANSPEDLIETHKITGIITNIDENNKYYVVIINPVLWGKTTAEQRQLIRCSTTEIARSKGLEGGIIDPIKKERLH